MPKIALIGTFIRDRIIPLEGPEVQCLGGLYHSLAYTSLLAGSEFQIIPVARIGKDYFPKVKEVLSEFYNIDLSNIIVEQRENTAVTLRYRTPTTRDEITSPPMQSLQANELRGVLDADGILVNLISGDDVTLEALQWLSEKSEGIIYLDFHSRALGIDALGRRFYRKPVNWQAWLKACDFVQMNEGEAACLCGKNELSVFREFLREMLNSPKLKGMFITLGESGVLAGMKNEKGQQEIQYIFAHSCDVMIRDIIGCGDAFGAAFFTHYLTKRNFWQATEFANRVAARNATFMGSITKEHFETHIKPYAIIEE